MVNNDKSVTKDRFDVCWSWTAITESAVHRIRLIRCIFCDVTAPLVNNTSKLYIEYLFAPYYKASNSISM